VQKSAVTPGKMATVAESHICNVSDPRNLPS
jgi:hypothetical protein